MAVSANSARVVLPRQRNAASKKLPQVLAGRPVGCNLGPSSRSIQHSLQLSLFAASLLLTASAGAKTGNLRGAVVPASALIAYECGDVKPCPAVPADTFTTDTTVRAKVVDQTTWVDGAPLRHAVDYTIPADATTMPMESWPAQARSNTDTYVRANIVNQITWVDKQANSAPRVDSAPIRRAWNYTTPADATTTTPTESWPAQAPCNTDASVRAKVVNQTTWVHRAAPIRRTANYTLPADATMPMESRKKKAAMPANATTMPADATMTDVTWLAYLRSKELKGLDEPGVMWTKNSWRAENWMPGWVADGTLANTSGLGHPNWKLVERFNGLVEDAPRFDDPIVREPLYQEKPPYLPQYVGFDSPYVRNGGIHSK